MGRKVRRWMYRVVAWRLDVVKGCMAVPPHGHPQGVQGGSAPAHRPWGQAAAARTLPENAAVGNLVGVTAVHRRCPMPVPP